jgi:hypothetical protein
MLLSLSLVILIAAPTRFALVLCPRLISAPQNMDSNQEVEPCSYRT